MEWGCDVIKRKILSICNGHMMINQRELEIRLITKWILTRYKYLNVLHTRMSYNRDNWLIIYHTLVVSIAPWSLLVVASIILGMAHSFLFYITRLLFIIDCIWSSNGSSLGHMNYIYNHLSLSPLSHIVHMIWCHTKLLLYKSG